MPAQMGGFANIDSVREQLEEYQRGVIDAAKTFVRGEAERIMERALEIVPRETGELAASAYIDPIQERGDHVSVAMGFTAPHAVLQHERLEWRHPKGGRAKYLETAVYEAAPGASSRARDIIEDQLREKGLG